MTVFEAEFGGNLGPMRYQVGDQVEVLNSIRLPKVEEVIHRGVVRRITNADATLDKRLYWIYGRATAVTSRQLRLVVQRKHELWRAYPADWVACPTCGDPVMDGRATCGRADCGSPLTKAQDILTDPRRNIVDPYAEPGMLCDLPTPQLESIRQSCIDHVAYIDRVLAERVAKGGR